MPKETSLENHLVALVWSQWAELGVSGWSRRHQDFAVDPEALIVLTAWLGDSDPRLRDESTDWCVRYGRFISGARLKNVVRESGYSDTPWWNEFAATVNSNSRLNWPTWRSNERPRRFEPSRKSRSAGFGRPSLIFLRVRAAVGLGARAEVLRLFATRLRDRLAVADIATQIGYSKRNTAEALDGLEMAGLLTQARVRNRSEYGVADGERLLALVEPRPRWTPAWVPIVRVAIRVAEFFARSEVPESVADVDSIALARDLDSDVVDWGIAPPVLFEADGPAHVRLSDWANEVFGGLAEADPRILSPRQVIDSPAD